MKNKTKLWRLFFAIGLFAIAIQQLVVADFMPVILPAGYPAWLSHRLIWDWVFSILLAAACLCIFFRIKARLVSLLTAGVLLLFVLIFQVPGQLSIPEPFHLFVWSNPFKELTLSGGAFLVAGSFARGNNVSGLEHFLEKLIPSGKYFFAVTMVVFGAMHFVYLDFVTIMVPNWIPGHIFWAQLAGIGLMAGGLGIILNIKRHLAAKLLGVSIFIWLIVLHIPRAIADPYSGNGNEVVSVFEALAFSGIAFLISE
jgi:uncharacterized membrane protein